MLSRLSFFFAFRYLKARKSHNLIHIISLVSMIGVAIGTMGFIIVLSVFNGFGNLVLSLYDSFDPDIRITPLEGKTFDPEQANWAELVKSPVIDVAGFSLEEKALLRYRDRQLVAELKGVAPSFIKSSALGSKMIAGKFATGDSLRPAAVVGAGIAWKLGISEQERLPAGLQIILPRKNIDPSLSFSDPSAAFSERSVPVSGIFSVQQDFDMRYIILPIGLVRELTDEALKVSAIEIKLKDPSDQEAAVEELSRICGAGFQVSDRYRQHDFLYRILKYEKIAVFLILGFILLLAAFNLLGTLAMLILEKKEDIKILRYMGAQQKQIASVFRLEGVMISMIGAVAGLIIGLLICAGQYYFGWISLENAEGFVVEAYPVDIRISDIGLVLLTVFLFGLLSARLSTGILLSRSNGSGYPLKSGD